MTAAERADTVLVADPKRGQKDSSTETSLRNGSSEQRRHWWSDIVVVRWGIGSAIVVVVAAGAMACGALPVDAEPSNTATLSPVVGLAASQPAVSPLVPSTADAAVHPIVHPVVESVVDSEIRSLPPRVVQAVDDRHGPVDHPAAPHQADSEVRPLAHPVVVLYGDSLAWEAQDAFVEALGDRTGLTVVVRTFGGTAICDWLGTMADDATSLSPGAVVVEFSGNTMTPCMQDTAGQPLAGTAFVERYTADAEAVIATFAPTGAQIVFAGAPISRSAEESGDFNGGRLNDLYERIGRIHDGVRYFDAGASVLASGHWTATLPCLPGEPCTGGFDAAGQPVNVVRAPDGGHFCPASKDAVRGVTGACPMWSSGAFRYGSALAHPVIESLDLSPSRS